MIISGQYIDISKREIYPADIVIENGIIISITPCIEAPDHYIMPGFVDAHIHIESSMLIPTEFSKLALVHGTIGTVSDPHEIANVLGIKGIDFMIENTKLSPLKCLFGAPSCVPATSFEHSGASISADDIHQLLSRDDIGYLSEMMNFPGVLNNDEEILKKISSARFYNKPIDGHAPGLLGNDAKTYISHGISTDHECTTLQEALDKISHGMKILIREGSAAKNFDALHPLISLFPHMCMFCSDDKHPDSLLEGHINILIKKAIHLGYDLFDVLSIACVHPVKHYSMPIGLLNIGDPADFIIVDSLIDFTVKSVFINGEQVVQNGTLDCTIPSVSYNDMSICNTKYITEKDIILYGDTSLVHVIEAIPGQIVTGRSLYKMESIDGILSSSTIDDILKIIVINRYSDSKPAIGFIKGFGLKCGAIASTIAHDSHNIIAVGVDDTSIMKAVNALIEEKGGISLYNNTLSVLPLDIAGLMSSQDAHTVANRYIEIERLVKQTGCTMPAPYMALSFMALLVIPTLKLSDIGLFDGEIFECINLIQSS
ncbi:MAG: adenine deaminase [Bacteroidota bacterium]